MCLVFITVKYSFLKSYGKFKICFTRKYPSRLQKWFTNCKLMCQQNSPKLWCRYEFIVYITYEIPRLFLNEFNRKYPVRLQIRTLKNCSRIRKLYTRIIQANHVLTSVLVGSNRQDPAHDHSSDASCKCDDYQFQRLILQLPA